MYVYLYIYIYNMIIYTVMFMRIHIHTRCIHTFFERRIGVLLGLESQILRSCFQGVHLSAFAEKVLQFQWALVQRKGLNRTSLELISVVVGDLEQCTSNTGWQEEMSSCRCCTDTCVAACCLDPVEMPGRADLCKQPVQLIGGRGFRRLRAVTGCM